MILRGLSLEGKIFSIVLSIRWSIKLFINGKISIVNASLALYNHSLTALYQKYIKTDVFNYIKYIDIFALNRQDMQIIRIDCKDNGEGIADILKKFKKQGIYVSEI